MQTGGMPAAGTPPLDATCLVVLVEEDLTTDVTETIEMGAGTGRDITETVERIYGAGIHAVLAATATETAAVAGESRSQARVVDEMSLGVMTRVEMMRGDVKMIGAGKSTTSGLSTEAERTPGATDG